MKVADARSAEKVWLTALDRRLLRAEGKMPPPISIEIQPTSSCNLRCQWCSYWERNGFDGARSQRLDFEIIVALAEYARANGVRSAYLSGGGEPCTYGRIADAVEELGAAGLRLALITNGTLVTKRLMPVAQRFGYILTSLIAPRPEMYQSAAGRNFFEAMIAMPRQIRTRWGEESPTIAAMYVLSNSNYTGALDAISVARKASFDYCSFRVAHDFEQRGVGLSESAQRWLRERVPGDPDANSDFTNLADVLDSPSAVHPIGPICSTVHLGLFANVDPRGDVYLSVPDIGKQTFSIGNLYEERFSSIWGGERHHEVLAGMQDRYVAGQCSPHCRGHRYNQSLQRPPSSDIPAVHRDFM